MFELDRRDSVRKVKYLEFSDIVNIERPAIKEIVDLALQNIDRINFGKVSWYATAINVVTKKTLGRRGSLDIIAKALGYRNILDLHAHNRKGKGIKNPHYDPNDNYLILYENEAGVFTHVGINYV